MRKEEYVSNMTEIEKLVLTEFVSRNAKLNNNSVYEINVEEIETSFSAEEKDIIIKILQDYGIKIIGVEKLASEIPDRDPFTNEYYLEEEKVTGEIEFGMEEILSNYAKNEKYVDDFTLERCLLLYTTREILLEILKSLPEEERSIIIDRYGFETGKKKTLKEVSLQTGLTIEEVRNREWRALKAMRHPDCLSKLKDFLHKDFDLLADFDNLNYDDETYFRRL